MYLLYFSFVPTGYLYDLHPKYAIILFHPPLLGILPQQEIKIKKLKTKEKEETRHL